MNRKIFMATICLAGIIGAVPGAAQNTNRFTFNAGAGFTEPVRFTEDRLSRGFNLNVGGGINFTPSFGLIGEFGYNDLGLTDAALAAANVPNGSTRVLSLTANPIFRFNPRGRFDVYAIGGGGWYRRTVEFTEPTIATVTAFDPFWGVFFPVAVPANQVIGSFSQNKPGLNAGGGISFSLRGDSNAKIYAEARYHYLFTDNVRTTLLPVTFGLRW
jgi:opacity protein-like surface antigen